ncbi:hypothetical protein KPH14_009291 [Odynerus spinipes]|uniref:Uncharacterized protein n=1 Tax=Odynerus spinipes TaxID=1348599 RepID=A0AAD9RP98_9HYME|nr:hypothetical protein KPH14_009291 [Odynerus spinipes]
MRAAEDVHFILGLNILWVITTCAAPLSSPQADWEKGENLTPVITSECSPDARCLEVLPLAPILADTVIVPEEIPATRLQTRRQIVDEGTDSVLESWKDGPPILESESRPPSLPTKRVSSKTIKKDSFLSRGWGAGGMPFSVLYMTPHGSRLNHATNTATGTGHQQEVGKTNENPVPPLTQPNYRVAVRNSAAMQSRRQYPIIPQFFISYGWGALGK